MFLPERWLGPWNLCVIETSRASLVEDPQQCSSELKTSEDFFFQL
jgi:hypothetical protein